MLAEPYAISVKYLIISSTSKTMKLDKLKKTCTVLFFSIKCMIYLHIYLHMQVTAHLCHCVLDSYFSRSICLTLPNSVEEAAGEEDGKIIWAVQLQNLIFLFIFRMIH